MKGKANIIVGAIVVVVVAVAIAVYAVLQMGVESSEDKFVDSNSLCALVHDSDGAVWEFPLSVNAEQTVSTKLGMNVVVVEDGKVYVRDADCDNHDCIRQGKISSPGRQIICLPHKLWIEVVDDGQGPGQMDKNAVAGESHDVSTSEGFDAVVR